MIDTLKIKAKLVELGLTQDEVAQELGIDYSTLNKKLNNGRRMYIDECHRLCNILHVTTSKDLKEFFGLDFLIGGRK